MQFIEKNALNVRSAIYHLRKDDGNLEFILFPMVHVGTKEYYADISRRLANCDVILAEGIDSKRTSLLTLSYRIVKKIRRMDLITQSDGMNVSMFRAKILNTDMAGHVFDERWTALPLSLKAQIFALIPFYLVYLILFGTRETIAHNIALQDFPSRDETLLQDENLDKLDDLLIDKRDQQLIGNIEKLHDTGRYDKKTVGVIYGAMHMRNIVSFLLRKLNYKVKKAEWVTVFDL
jgi:hypothetical protein